MWLHRLKMSSLKGYGQWLSFKTIIAAINFCVNHISDEKKNWWPKSGTTLYNNKEVFNKVSIKPSIKNYDKNEFADILKQQWVNIAQGHGYCTLNLTSAVTIKVSLYKDCMEITWNASEIKFKWNVSMAITTVVCHLWPLLLTWSNFNPSMDR